VIFAVVTFNDGSMTVNSGDVASTSGGNQGLSHVLAVGANIPDTWGVRNGQPVGTLPATADGNAGVDLRFAPWPEVTGDGDTFGPPSCRIGGHDPVPGGSTGVIAGYNVYRIPDGGTTPTAQDFYDAATDGSAATGGYLYFANTSTLDMSVADTGDGASDSQRPGDLVGLFNTDGTAYTGDDTVVFQDSASNPDGSARVGVGGPRRRHDVLVCRAAGRRLHDDLRARRHRALVVLVLDGGGPGPRARRRHGLDRPRR